MEIETIRFYDMCKPTEKQKVAFRALNTFKYILYGGAAGGGKSFWLRWACVYQLLKWFARYDIRGIRVGLFCENYPTLKDRQLSRVEYEFPRWLGTLKRSESEFHLAPQYGSGVIAFRNLDDPAKYSSSEFALVAIDEVTRNKQDVFNYLRMRNRWSGIEDPKFIGATNPDGIGHTWVKKMFVDRQFEPNEQEMDKFTYIPATAYDNPHLSPTYFEQLRSLPENLRKAYLDGNWDVFEGQFFSEFDRNLHLIQPFNVGGLEKYLCLDYGWTAPSAVYWVAKDKANPKKKYYYRELYETKRTPEALANEIADMTPRDEQYELTNLYCDPSIWASKAGEASIANIISEVFAKRAFPLRLVPANNDRVAGAYALREDLKPYFDYDNKLTSNFLIFDGACPNLVRTMPSLVFSKRNPEDIDTQCEDHAYDAVRYGRMTDVLRKLDYKAVMDENIELPQLESVGAYW